MLGVGSRFLQQLCRCLENLDRLSDGQAEIEDENLCADSTTNGTATVRLALRPTSGPYKGGRFIFQIKMSLSNPCTAPEIKCLNRIYHPNIDPTEDGTNVCLSLIEEWQPSYSFDDIVQGLLFLLHNPNLSDPLSPYFDPDMDEGEFQHNVMCSLLGQQVEGCFFDATVMQADDPHKGKRSRPTEDLHHAVIISDAGDV